MADKLEQWIEWGHKVALGVCSDETQHALRSYLRKIAGKLPQGVDAWQEFETYVLVPRKRSGKVYKNWLFGEVAKKSDQGCTEEHILNGLRKGVAKSLRTALREADVRKRAGVSSRVLLRGDLPAEERPSEEESVWITSAPDSASQAADRELDALAPVLAEPIFERLKHHHRVALAVRSRRRVPLYHPVVLQVARRKNAVVSDSVHQVREIIRQEITRLFPRADRQELGYLDAKVSCALVLRCYQWTKSEISCQPLFTIEGYNEDDANGC